MDFHTADFRDPRRRFYLPVTRVVHASLAAGADFLTGNREFQPIIFNTCDYPRCTLAPGGSIVLDFGRALHGGVRIVSGEFNSPRLRVRFGESVSEAVQESVQDHARKEETLHLQNRCGLVEYGNTVFRFVQLTNMGDSEIGVTNVTAVALEQDLEVTGSFDSSDARLNDIWRTAVRTVHLCMQDYLYDGAKRDRCVWMGDMHPEIQGILCAFSDTAVIRRSFEYLMCHYRPGEAMNGVFSYNCWFLIGLWDYCCVSRDLTLLRAYGGYIRTTAELLASYVGPDGAERIPGRRFLDWPNDRCDASKHAGLQALLLWSLEAGGKIFRELGFPADKLAAAAASLRCHVPDPAGRKAPAALLTLTGLADRTDVLEQDPFHDISTFYGAYILQAKKTVPALDLIRKYWGAMLDLGATSFWEDFNLDWARNAFRIDEMPVPGKADVHADFGDFCYKSLRLSLSHGWSCGPATFLSGRVLGVTFPAPGLVRVRPDIGDLEFVRGAVPSPSGLVRVELQRGREPKIEIPPGLQPVETDITATSGGRD